MFECMTEREKMDYVSGQLSQARVYYPASCYDQLSYYIIRHENLSEGDPCGVEDCPVCESF